jgi:hypothetical protein
MRRINIFSLRRSGHHAIIEWVIPILGGNVSHQNDVPRIPEGLRDDYRIIYGDGAEVLIHNYEDVDFRDYHESGECWFVLRDVHNTFASRLKVDGMYDWWVPWKCDDVELWKVYCREFAGKTNFSNALFINYNLWFADRSYRVSLADQIGGKFTDEALELVGQHGNGSSFDFRKYNGRAQQMQTTQRWKYFTEDLNYWNLFDEESIELSSSVFGNVVQKIYY